MWFKYVMINSGIMVRKYIKKINGLSYTDGQMQLAIKDALEGKSMKASAKRFGVPRQTLQKRLKQYREKENEEIKSEWNFSCDLAMSVLVQVA